MGLNLMELSKVLSHALRHAPEEYGLTTDREGYVEVADLVAALEKKGWKVTAGDIVQMVETAQKKRHEVNGSKIRAYYGHTIDENIKRTATVPPATLYHGTVASSLGEILINGLKPMQRNYVHLSAHVGEAEIVGGRRKGDLVILTIRAKEAFEDGIAFYPEQNNIWLAPEVPPKYIQE